MKSSLRFISTAAIVAGTAFTQAAGSPIAVIQSHVPEAKSLTLTTRQADVLAPDNPSDVRIEARAWLVDLFNRARGYSTVSKLSDDAKDGHMIASSSSILDKEPVSSSLSDKAARVRRYSFDASKVAGDPLVAERVKEWPWMKLHDEIVASEGRLDEAARAAKTAWHAQEALPEGSEAYELAKVEADKARQSHHEAASELVALKHVYLKSPIPKQAQS